MNYIYAKIQAEICMLTSQNSPGLNRAILRQLWLMTSAAAYVISVPSVLYTVLQNISCPAVGVLIENCIVLIKNEMEIPD